MSAVFSECVRKGGRAATEGRWDVAEQAFRGALRLDSTSADACRSLAAVLHILNRLDEAVEMWHAALNLEPDSGVSHFNLGLISMAKQEFGMAKESFANALRLKPNLADAAFNLGRIAYHDDDRAAAQKFFEQAVAIQPRHGEAYATLVQVLTEQGLETEAVAAGQRSLQALHRHSAEPPQGYVDMLMHMANACRRLGDLDGAAIWYAEAADADPDNSIAKHLLAAAWGTLSHEHAKDFTTKSFDSFARGFDDHLRKILNYRSPENLAADLHKLRPRSDAFSAILDLGCGTGLMGVALAQYFQVNRLVGVDLSRNMLDMAADKNLYHDLVHGDIVPVTSDSAEVFDLIISADVFIDVGEISDVFDQVVRRLKLGGLFAFTVEISAGSDVELTPMGRYRHSRLYLRRLAAEYGMSVVRESGGFIRRDARDDIMGRYVYLEKR